MRVFICVPSDLLAGIHTWQMLDKTFFCSENGDVSPSDGLKILQNLTNGMISLKAQQHQMNYMVHNQKMHDLHSHLLPINLFLPRFI